MRISDWSSDVCSSDLLAGAVGMERTHGAIMAGVHCGQQIKALRAADFAKDDTIRTHTQGVLDEVANGDLALPFKVRRTRFQDRKSTSELQSLMRTSYAVFCLKQKRPQHIT